MRIVYHYTDSHGFFGILQSGELWATDLRFLNDVTELAYGLDLARDVIDGMKESVSMRHQRLLALVADALDLTGTGPLSKPRFAVSFAGDGDLITQWRAYADFGVGYALGFDLKALKEVSRCENTLYEKAKTASQMEQILTDLIGRDTERPLPNGPQRGTAAREAAQRCIELALFAKHPAFADEREVRLVFESGEPKYRVRGAEVIPYTSVDMAGDESRVIGGLREVILGPLATDRAEAGVVDLLKSCGYEHVTVARSTVPFRG